MDERKYTEAGCPIKNRKKIIVCIILCLCILITVVLAVILFTQRSAHEPIVILYENDVHCAVDGYSKLLALKNECSGSYQYVGVVSSGDFVQGGTLGAVSKGEYIIELMNLVGYDAVALGNHEFDYLIPQLLELGDLSDAEFLSCNFWKIGEDRSYFEPYTMVSYANVDIAYIGITTPQTITASDPAQFKNGDGELVYTFHEEDLCEVVQANIDAAEQAGADYVIALSHMGYSEDGSWFDITDIIENTDGFDVVLDAHSHSVIEEMTVKDRSGDDVLLSSTGTKFAYIGKLTITEDGFDTELIETAAYEKTDPEADAYIAKINENYAVLGDRVIGESTVTLNTHDGETRLVRNSETAIGNLCSDAIRSTTGADLAYVNGGGLRAPIEAGEVTFNDLFSVFPYNNQVVTIEITGQMLLDMLEMSLMYYPEESGSFPSMSGVTFSVDTAIPTSVRTDENGFFTGVDGDRRVYDVKVLDPERNEYCDLVPDQSYVIAGFYYHLIAQGDGLAMFRDATLVDAEEGIDIELLESYIADHLGGVIADEYALPQGRIVFTQGH